MQQLSRLALTFTLLLSVLVPAVLSSAWDSRNDPSSFDSFYPAGPTFSLSALPVSGGLPVVPWPDTYWPSYLSGIAYRWASDDPQNFNYTLYTKAQLQSMSLNDLVLLSPAEKYDIYVGRYDYPTVQSEWQRTSPEDQQWEGICHGWAPAALQYQQPNPVTLKNPDGISVPFGSSDVKALLDYFVAEYADQSAQTDFIGDRCNIDIEQDPSKENVSSCADLNAGAFHVLITNMLSQNVLQGFVGDRDRSIQVWNQPIYKFASQVTDQTRAPSAGSARGTVKEVYVETRIYYTLEMQPQYKPITRPYIGHSDYQYWLELDANSNIVGGSYAAWDRLDFSWMQAAVSPFSGFFKPVQVIYAASTNGSTAIAAEALSSPPKLPAVVLTEEKGELRSSPPGKNYKNDYLVRWSIAPKQGVEYSAIEFEFVDFATERHRDKVRIYEELDGSGALVGVFHGAHPQVPRRFVVRSNGALVVFKTDSSGTDKGFTIRYRGIVSQ